MSSPNPEPFAAARFVISAEIRDASTDKPIVTFGVRDSGFGTENFGDIVAVSATFALNTIPTASLVLAVGNNTITGDDATIYDIRNRIKARDGISVFLEIIPFDVGDKTKIRAAKYKIFEGFVVGIGYQRSHNHANYVLNLVHWLDDLNNSTSVNGDWLPGAPADYAAAAMTTILNTGGTTSLGTKPTFTIDLVAQQAREDLWAKVIKPACQKLAGYNPRANILGDAENNPAALAALDRMPGAGAAANKYYRPLELRVQSDNNFHKSLNDYFTNVFADPSAQNSFWAKIITEIAPDFLFAISPAVDWALPIPVCAGLRWPDDGKVIAASEYNYANFNANMSQIIEAVHIIYPLTSNVNAAPEKTGAAAQQPNSYRRMYASYPPPEVISADKEKRGLKLFKQPPRWLDGIDATGLLALYTIQTNVLTTGTPTPAAKLSLPDLVNSTIDAVENAKSIVADFAQQMYCNKVLQQRVGELSGALRFDIAPGSIVKIMTPLRDATTNNEHVIASVMAVSYVINAERATAGTSFTIAHTKTEAESTNEFYSVPRPPLYGNSPAYTPFYDGPLAEPI
jgi:hypothetical protein